MAVIRLLPNAPHFREFVNDPITGHHYTATCGETALAAAMVLATPQIESTADAINLMTSLTREMMSLGWADSPNGATTTGRLHQEAERRGFKVASPYIQWQDPIPSDTLHPLLRQWSGIKPVVLMVTNGQALRAIDGSHDEVGLHGHFITIVGIADEGYIAQDGDNSAIANHLVTYPWSVIEAAHVTGFLMLENEQEVPMTAPAGLGAGFAAKYIQLGLTAPVVVPETYWNDHECFAVLGDSTVFYYNAQTNEVIADTSRGPKAAWLIHVCYDLWQAAKNAAPQPAPLSDAQKADIALGQAFRAAVKAA